ncbi:MAG: NUDIX domain-containing protein [Dysgonamonadaceae bacterium]|jgi:isopentenyldiphosphate isomerase|nr:NUDIX domain-containing protein [Dysgonamonadaceae bacterium]
MDEVFPLVNKNGQVIGRALRSECHNGSKLLHPVIHLHIFNNKGELFLQKRSEKKDIQPGKWDTSVGGHIDFGESVENALKREAREELGIIRFDPVFLRKYVFESEVEKELVYSYKTTYEGDIRIDESEVTEGQFWTMEKIKDSIGTGIFTPNFEDEFIHLI